MNNLSRAFYIQTPFFRAGLLFILFGIIQSLFFFTFYARFGDFAAAFALVPVVAAGWLLGRQAALAAGLAVVLSNIVLFATAGSSTGVNGWVMPGSLLTVFAGLIAGWAGDHIRALQAEIERRHQAEQLTILLETTRAAAATLDLDDLLRLVAERIVNALQVTECVWSRWDREADALVTLLDFSLKDLDYIEPPGTISPLSQYPLARQVLTSGEPTTVFVYDPKADPAEVAFLKQFGVRSAFIFPLAAANQVVGLVELYDLEQERGLTGEESALCQALLSQIAAVIVNANLFKESRYQTLQLATLNELAGEINMSLDAAEVCRLVTNRLHTAFGFHNVAVFTADYQAQELVICANAGAYDHLAADVGSRVPFAKGIMGRAVRTGQAVIANDIREYPEFFSLDDMVIRSEAVLPLIANQEILGVLNIDSDQLNAFGKKEVALLTTVANQLSTALQKARLFAESQEEIEERKRAEASLRQQNLTLELLAEISRELAVSFKINPVLDTVVRLAGQALDLTSVYICDWNKGTGLSTVLAEYISNEASSQEKLSDLGRVSHLLQGFDDTAEWLQKASNYQMRHLNNPDLSPAERAYMAHRGVQSIVYVPLWVGQQAIGYLEGWESRRKRHFSPYEIGLLQAIGRQISIGVYNARLYESVRQSEEQFRLVFELAPSGMIIASLDGRFQKVNQAYCTITGYSPDELIGRPVIEKTHPEDVDVTVEMIRQLREGEVAHFSIQKRYIRKDGATAYAILQVVRVVDNAGEPLHFVAQVIDITQRTLAEEELYRNTFYDSLTGLPNRALFLNYLQRAIGRTGRQSRYSFAVLFLDLDRFKIINDSLGHSAGDQVLKGVAHRLSTCIRPGDVVARLGGDEFAILLDDIVHIGEAQLMVDKVQEALRKPIFLNNHELALSGSIGITVNTARRHNPEDYVRDADIAMYKAKLQGGGRSEIFANHMHVLALDRFRLETELRQAINQEELVVYYQPVLSIPNGQLCKVEALLRWPHARQGFIPPAEFIPLAEETGLIHPISHWLIDTACKQVKAWHDLGYRLRLAINVSVHQFQFQNLPAVIQATLAKTGLPATDLELEVTESIALLSENFSIAPLQKLSEMGVTISIDDFGTGYSSLSRLRSLPIHTLKIDRSFISNMMTNANNKAIVTAIITMAHGLQLKVVAEGVESAEQYIFLREQACDEAQGFLFSPPITAERMIELLPRRDLWLPELQHAYVPETDAL